MKDVGLVSIIIPVYGVEKYLAQCLESVCGQTYSNLEIIVIDDESPDMCGEIADAFAEKDSRVKVLHIQNRGAAGARNVGLDVCTGDYVMFVDSDDWLELHTVERMMTVFYQENGDIVQCQYMDEYKHGSMCHTYIEQDHVCNAMEFVQDMIRRWEYIINCNKIYRRNVVHDLRFVEGRCIDDEFYTYRAILNAKKIVLITDYLYHYRQRKSSATENKGNEKQRLKDQVDFVTQRYEPLCQAFPKLKSKLLEHMAAALMSVMRNGAEYEECYQVAREQLKKKWLQIVLMSGIHWNVKKSVVVYLLTSRETFLGKKDRTISTQEGHFD